MDSRLLWPIYQCVHENVRVMNEVLLFNQLLYARAVHE